MGPCDAAGFAKTRFCVIGKNPQAHPKQARPKLTPRPDLQLDCLIGKSTGFGSAP